jgi:hypothetical protein
MYASRGHLDVSSISEQTAKKPFRNRAAANVTCADKENVFHDSSGARERDSNLESNLSKSILRRTDRRAVRAFPGGRRPTVFERDGF